MAAENDRDDEHGRAQEAAHAVLAKHPCVVPGKGDEPQEPADETPGTIGDADPSVPRQGR